MIRRLFVAVAAAILTSVMVGCGGGVDSGDKGYVSSNQLITKLPPDERVKPDAVSGIDLDGKPISLARFAGQVIVLNVWGSWCPPCRAEAPDLVAAHRELAPRGVVFVGINTRDSSTGQPKAFEKKYDVDYPSIYDPSGKTLLSFRQTLNPNAIPSTLIIDKQGRVAASILDRVPSTKTLVDLVDEVATE